MKTGYIKEVKKQTIESLIKCTCVLLYIPQKANNIIPKSK